MKSKLILALLLFGAGLLPISGETVSTVNIGSSMLKTNFFTRGTYSSFPFMEVYINPAYPNCYFSDLSDFNATYDGKAIEATPVCPDADGLCTKIMFILNETNPGKHTLNFDTRVKYVDKNNPSEDELYTNATNSRHGVQIWISEYTTIESLTQMQIPGQTPVAEVTSYLFDNPPGEYDYLFGDYAIRFSYPFTGFCREIGNISAPVVIDENGNVVEVCDNMINRQTVFTDHDATFHVKLNRPITTPGKYWIVYPMHGALKYFVESSTGGYNNLYHVMDLKDGPYVVKGLDDASVAPEPAQLEWMNDCSIALDLVPDTLRLRVANASQLGCHKNDAGNYGAYLVNGTDSVSVTGLNIVDGNVVCFPVPASWSGELGDYRLVVKTPDAVLKGFTSAGHPISFSEADEISFDFSVVTPQLPETVDLYVRSSSAEQYEIGEDEAVSLRLMHTDQNIGMKIFVRWTGEPAEFAKMSEDEDGFTEHNSDVEITSPGRLEYYTTRGTTRSDVKTITFVAKPTSAVNEMEYIKHIPGEEGLYDLRGTRIPSNPTAGIYIRRFPDGTIRKVIVR